MRLSEEDERLAVLFVLERISPARPAAAVNIFSMLPVMLQVKWSLKYLRDHVLVEMIQKGWIRTRRVAPGTIYYALAPEGRRLLRPQGPTESPPYASAA